jgi:REP element-mobilizing transposase RayT
MEPKGRHQRGYLPHRDYGSALQALTFRETDCLPKHVVDGWKTELQQLLESPHEEIQTKAKKKLAHRIARYEDAGHGTCLLRRAEFAEIVQDCLLDGHQVKYQLIAWCIMPNHVHVLIKQNKEQSLGKIVQRWKGRSARRINLALEKKGPLWAKDYFDRVIRDEDHFWNAISYIHCNPIRAGLVNKSEEWSFSSLGYGWPLPQH